MKKRLAPAALAVAAALLAGCGTTALPYAREMGDMALLRTMGWTPERRRGPPGDGLHGKAGRRASGRGAAAPDPVGGGRLPQFGLPGHAGAQRQLCFYGYVDQLLLGEELALEGVQTVLDYLPRMWNWAWVHSCG